MGEDGYSGVLYFEDGTQLYSIGDAVVSVNNSNGIDATAVAICKISEATETVNVVAFRASTIYRRTITTLVEALAFCYPNKRVSWLALYHRRERVRKKNMRRIARWVQRRVIE